jgi:hypothetical protein
MRNRLYPHKSFGDLAFLAKKLNMVVASLLLCDNYYLSNMQLTFFI